MSARAQRRRLKPQVKVKVAFEGDGDDSDNERPNNPEISKGNDSTIPNQNINRNNGDVDVDRCYERAFFSIHNATVEVILENNILSWSTVTGETSHDETSRRKPIDRNDGNSVNLKNVFAISPIHANWNWSLNVNENIAGTTVSIRNSITVPTVSSSSTLPPNSALRGFQLHSFQTLADNILQEILIIFQSEDSNLLDRWYHLLSKILSEYKISRHIFVVCNPYAGSKQTRNIYNTKIKVLLEKAQYKTTYAEISDQFTADEALNNFESDFDSIDGLLIIGGDGSVINVINALIRYLAKQNRIRLDMGNDFPAIPFPICIVPDGTTNIISHTIHGNTDHVTPVLHLILNQKLKIDMSAIFDIDYNFVTANFGAGAGYPANVLKYFPRYSLRSPKTVIKKSSAKAASNKNLQSIEMEIRYIPANQNNSQINRCYQNCLICNPEGLETSDDQVKAFDDSHIQQITRRIKSSSHNNDNTNRLSSAGRTSYHNTEKEKNWKILHSNYLQVAVLTNANLWSFAPQGLSKFGHLADGLLDLIIIEPVKRKEFLRYIKRNGNSKNQYDLPFTNIIKVKEIEIELKLPIDNFSNEIINTDNQFDSTPSDDSSNEDMSDNENNKSAGLQRHQPHPPSVPISEDSRRRRRHRPQINTQTQESIQHTLPPSKSMETSALYFKNSRQSQQSENEMDGSQGDPYDSTASRRRSGIFQSLKIKKNRIPLPRPSSARGEESNDERQQKKNRKIIGGTLRPARSLLNLLTSGNSSSGNTDKPPASSSRNSPSAGPGRRPSVISRSSSVDYPKTSNVNNASRNKKRPCMWNLDFSPYNSPLIRIKCFCRYLTVFGVGLHADTRLKETNYSCF